MNVFTSVRSHRLSVTPRREHSIDLVVELEVAVPLLIPASWWPFVIWNFQSVVLSQPSFRQHFAKISPENARLARTASDGI